MATDRTQKPGVRMTRRGALALAAMAAALPHATTMAQATPEEARQHPNTYRLSGEGLEITYASSSFSGEPTFTLGGPATELEFRGDQIQVEESGMLGQLVSVMSYDVADGYTQWLTVLLPEINLTGGSEPAPFSTLAIQTQHLTTIAGPEVIDGALTTYEVIPLDGTAELLLF